MWRQINNSPINPLLLTTSLLTQRKSILVYKPDFFCVVPGFLCCDLLLSLSLVKKINKSEQDKLIYQPTLITEFYKDSTMNVPQFKLENYRVIKVTKEKTRQKMQVGYRTVNWKPFYQQISRQTELQSGGAGSDLRCSWVCCLKDGHWVLNLLGIDQKRRSQEQNRSREASREAWTAMKDNACLFRKELERKWSRFNVLSGLKSTLSLRCGTVRKLIVRVNTIYRHI